MDMKKRKCSAALAVMVTAALVACGDSDDPTGDDIFAGNVISRVRSGYKIVYGVELADANVMEAADVLVEYLDADGNVQKDTVRDSVWVQTVNFDKSSTHTYGLAARYSPKDNPVLTQDTYDFDIDLSSPLYITYTDGTEMLWATLRNRVYDGILKKDGDGNLRSERSRDYLTTSYGRDDMDTTITSYMVTISTLSSSKDTLIYSTFEWQ